MKRSKQAYREFLQSDFWKEISAKARERDGKCVSCGSVKLLQAHHVHYPDDWYQTKLEDLETLCRWCHRKEHGRSVPGDFDWERYGIEMEFNRCTGPENSPTKERIIALCKLASDEDEIRKAGHHLRMWVLVNMGKYYNSWIQRTHDNGRNTSAKLHSWALKKAREWSQNRDRSGN